MKFKKLNGWRRIGIVASIIWVVILSTVLFIQYNTVRHSVKDLKLEFVFRGMPIGTIYDDGKVTLPNGKVVVINTRDPKTGAQLEPWDIDFSKYPEIPDVTQIFLEKWIAITFLLPALLIFIFECSVIALRWIKAGFKPRI